ncbi:MAG: hypothetical protein JO249_01230 [Acidobacteria bacterium]|nr:hypothetical protein [Acidobacteriota bacterium]
MALPESINRIGVENVADLEASDRLGHLVRVFEVLRRNLVFHDICALRMAGDRGQSKRNRNQFFFIMTTLEG